MMPAGCSHGCDVENIPYEPKWPEHWTTEERHEFREQCVECGFVTEVSADSENTMIILAHELNKASGDLSSLKEYLDETRAAGYLITDLMRRRMGILLAVSRIIRALTPKPSTPLWVALLQFIGLAIVFVPLGLVAVPVRIWFHYRVKGVQKRMVPLFNTWMADREQKTRTLRKAISDRIDEEGIDKLAGDDSGPHVVQETPPEDEDRRSTTSQYLRSKDDSDDGEGWEPICPDERL